MHTNLLCEFFEHSVKSSIAVQDFLLSLFNPLYCEFGQILFKLAAVKSGNDGHDENSLDELDWKRWLNAIKT